MKLSELKEAAFKTPLELVQHIAGNYNKAGGKNWTPQEVQVEHLRTKQYSQPKECFRNAFRYLLHEAIGKNAKYVLGYVFVGAVPIEHAWVQVDGKHIDTTLDSAQYDTYIMVVEFDLKQLYKFVNKNSHPPSSLYDALRI